MSYGSSFENFLASSMPIKFQHKTLFNRRWLALQQYCQYHILKDTQTTADALVRIHYRKHYRTRSQVRAHSFSFVFSYSSIPLHTVETCSFISASQAARSRYVVQVLQVRGFASCVFVCICFLFYTYFISNFRLQSFESLLREMLKDKQILSALRLVSPGSALLDAQVEQLTSSACFRVRQVAKFNTNSIVVCRTKHLHCRVFEPATF